MSPIETAALVALLQDPAATPPPPKDKVELKNGDILYGTVSGPTDGRLEIEHPTLGKISVPADDVKSFGPVPPPTAAEPESPWSHYGGLQFPGQHPENDNFNLRAAGGFVWKQEHGTLTLDAEYFYNVSNSTTLDNNFLATAVEKLDLGDSGWFGFGRLQYEWDQFQTWEHRFSGYLGPGYHVIKEETMMLDVYAGAGATYYYQTDEWRAELIVGEDFEWKIDERQKLVVNASFAPQVDDFADYRIEGRAEWSCLVGDKKKGLEMLLGVRDIYQSDPGEGGTPNDLRIYGGLNYTF